MEGGIDGGICGGIDRGAIVPEEKSGITKVIIFWRNFFLSEFWGFKTHCKKRERGVTLQLFFYDGESKVCASLIWRIAAPHLAYSGEFLLKLFLAEKSLSLLLTESWCSQCC